jgi:hypothetical protein
MSDEGKAGWAVVLWSIGFHAGVFIAAGINKAVGITLMICSTAFGNGAVCRCTISGAETCA